MTKKYKFLFHNIIAAPFDGFYEMRRMRKGNVWFVVLMYALYVLLQIIAYNFTGYLVNTNNPNNFNILKSIGSSLLPFLLFSIANYSITTLGDGKGFLSDIIKVLGYSLLPLIVFHVLALFLSWVISNDTAVFYYLFIAFGYIAFAIYAFIGLIVIHEYNFRQAILYLFLTVVAMMVIIFICVLLLTLFQNLLGFASSVWREIIMRR